MPKPRFLYTLPASMHFRWILSRSGKHMCNICSPAVLKPERGRECLLSHLCPGPHSFFNRTLLSVGWINGWQTANWGSQSSRMFTSSQLLASEIKKNLQLKWCWIVFKTDWTMDCYWLLIHARGQIFKRLMCLIALWRSKWNTGDRLSVDRY